MVGSKGRGKKKSNLPKLAIFQPILILNIYKSIIKRQKTKSSIKIQEPQGKLHKILYLKIKLYKYYRLWKYFNHCCTIELFCHISIHSKQKNCLECGDIKNIRNIEDTYSQQSKITHIFSQIPTYYQVQPSLTEYLWKLGLLSSLR